MKRKAGMAMGIIAALIGLALALDACIPLTHSALQRDVAIVADDSASGAASVDAQSALSGVFEEGSHVSGYSDQLPEGFSNEVIDGDGFDEVLVAEGGSVLGFVGSGSATGTFSRVSDELMAKGWLPIGGEQEAMGTFVKKDGTYTWLMLACSGVGDQATAVVQIKKALQ
ncbi:MAG: hypothetical protein RR547_01550 [Raoultibacter sp.]